MKNWNRTGKFKAILLGLLSLPNLLAPIGANPEINLVFASFIILVFGCLIIPLIAKFNLALFKSEISKPMWNDNPLNLKRPLSFFHFGAYFFIVIGLSMVIGSGIKDHILNSFALVSIFYGLGILLGIRLSLKWISKKG